MEGTTATSHEEMATRQSKTPRRNRKKEVAGPKFGDSHMVFDEASFGEEGYYFERASCQDVYKACCVHTKREWLWRAGAVVLLLVSVYFFMVGMDLLGTSAQVMAGCKAGEIFGASTNPLTALMVGILVTVLLQSSGTTTGVIVSLVEARVLTTAAGIYMVMGANIGTTVRFALAQLHTVQA
jgi:Na+/Pi-cotransporter